MVSIVRASNTHRLWVFLFLASPGWGVVAISTNTACTGNACTTPSVTTTGASLLVIGQSCFAGACTKPSDSKSNVWTALTQQSAGSNNESIWYSSNPVVGSGHTFTGAASIDYGLCVMAFSGVDTSANPFDQQNGASAGITTTIQPGSVTPTTDGQLLVTYYGVGASEVLTYTIDSGFTLTNQYSFIAGQRYGQACAYFVQTTAAAINPTWAHGGSNQTNSAATIGSFKASAAAAAATSETMSLLGI